MSFSLTNLLCDNFKIMLYNLHVTFWWRKQFYITNLIIQPILYLFIIQIIKEEGNYKADHENKKRKGGLGELIEERYFHYHSNNDARPDFDKAGVELKVTPYKKNKNGSISAKERLVLTMIDYYSVINEDFFNPIIWILSFFKFRF